MNPLPSLKKSEINKATFNPASYVEELKAKNLTLDLHLVKEVLVELCTNKESSRLIQERITQGTFEDRTLIFEGIREHITKLSNESSGNYCVQKLLEFGDDRKVAHIVEQINSDVYNLCLNAQGSKVVQRIFEVLPLEYRVTTSTNILEKPSAELDKIIKDQNGNHVIQKIIEKGFADNMHHLKENQPADKTHVNGIIAQLGKLMDKVRSNVQELCMHPLGCRVLQKVIECIPAFFLNDLVQNKIMGQIVILTEDKYGNQVIQHLIEHGDLAWKNKVVAVVKKNLLNLSNQKFSSNVVQMCLRKGSPQHKTQLIDSILYSENEHLIMDLMKNMQGNYVIQTALDEASEEQKHKIIRYARQNKNQLMRVRYSKHIFSKIDELTRSK